MRKTRRFTAAMVMVLIMLSTLTGCNWGKTGEAGGAGSGEPTEGSVSVAVVTGVRSNANVISINGNEICDKVYDSAYSHGRVVLVRCDGRPEQYLLTDIEPPRVKGLSESKLRSIAEGYRDEILATFDSEGAAKYPEADTLEAIRLSGNALRETDRSEQKYLIIVDPGLSTTGYLDFTKGLLDAPVEDIINGLEQEKAVPDLSGIDVIWLYCGETAEPQEPLSELQKAKLRDIYTAVLESANAKSVTFRDEAPSSEPYTGLPEVTTITPEGRDLDGYVMPTVKLDPEKVQFVGDSDEFIEPETARAEISKAADTLLTHPDNKVYVVGGTAGADGDEDYCRRLSDARAKAVVKVLNEFGVEDDRLIPMGLGSETPWHLDDTDSDGKMIEEIAQKNRSVWIVDVNDSEYGDVL